VLAWFRLVAQRVNEADQTLTRQVAKLPPSHADGALQVLTRAANHSVLWLAIAFVLGSRRGATRRAALRGVLAIGGTSLVTNVMAKPLMPRRRPAADALPDYRTLPNPPTSSSFPSGHAASAAAFATAVTIECPPAGAVIAPLAATVAYSRLHCGVHWPSDVLAGVLLGGAIALTTRRWWPVRPSTPAEARPHSDAPALADGAGLVVVTNKDSGDPATDPTKRIAQLLPGARTVLVTPGEDVAARLVSEIDAGTSAVGVAGGDGSVAAGAAVAARCSLPFAVLPAGTFNHFARDVGIETISATADAVRGGNAVTVDLAIVIVNGSVRHFVNTASLGGYPDLVRLRTQWSPRIGRWPAMVVALARVLARAEPLRMTLNGREMSAWMLFVGNGPYEPRGMVPVWRPALDSGLLDVRYLRADVRLSRLRFAVAALSGALHRSRVYVQREMPWARVRVRGRPVALATDGEVPATGNEFEFGVDQARLTVYRPEPSPSEVEVSGSGTSPA
jgi:undecaprenyl-diphosphatase